MKDHRLLKVDILIEQKNYTQAEKILKELLSETPNDVFLLSTYAELELARGQ